MTTESRRLALFISSLGLAFLLGILGWALSGSSRQSAHASDLTAQQLPGKEGPSVARFLEPVTHLPGERVAEGRQESSPTPSHSGEWGAGPVESEEGCEVCEGHESLPVFPGALTTVTLLASAAQYSRCNAYNLGRQEIEPEFLQRLQKEIDARNDELSQARKRFMDTAIALTRLKEAAGEFEIDSNFIDWNRDDGSMPMRSTDRQGQKLVFYLHPGEWSPLDGVNAEGWLLVEQGRRYVREAFVRAPLVGRPEPETDDEEGTAR